MLKIGSEAALFFAFASPYESQSLNFSSRFRFLDTPRGRRTGTENLLLFHGKYIEVWIAVRAPESDAVFALRLFGLPASFAPARCRKRCVLSKINV